MEQTDPRGSKEDSGCLLGDREKKIFLNAITAMWRKAQMVMWHITYVLADPNGPNPAWAPWS